MIRFLRPRSRKRDRPRFEHLLGIVQENGGRISVKETGPEGTTFLVELPLFVPAEDSDDPMTQDPLNDERNTQT